MDKQPLIDGVRFIALRAHVDTRGDLTEVFREEWHGGFHPLQWNVVHSVARVLRGVHMHVQHSDYLIMATGEMLLGLHDPRPDAPGNRQSQFVALKAEEPMAVLIPPGVCHGFYFPVPSTLIYAVSSYWSKDDEIGCRFDAPELTLAWPDAAPILSHRDQSAGTYDDMRAQYFSSQSIGVESSAEPS